MFKMSAFSVDTGRQTTPPLVDGVVHNFTPDWFSSYHTVRCAHKSGGVINFITVCHTYLKIARNTSLYDVQLSQGEFSPTSTDLFLHPRTNSTVATTKRLKVVILSVWNSLSLSTRSANTFGTFKSRLKTELFMSAYTT